MKISSFIGGFLLSSIIALAQPFYSNPAGDAGSGADLLGVFATDCDLSWDFNLSFAESTLDQQHFAFALFLDTDLLGTPSLVLGYPTTPNFGDDLYIFYNSIDGVSATVKTRVSDAESSVVGLLALNWEVNSLSFTVTRSFTTYTSGNAEFIILIGIPNNSGGFEIHQKMPAMFAQELMTATVPEPAAYAVILGGAALVSVIICRTRRVDKLGK